MHGKTEAISTETNGRHTEKMRLWLFDLAHGNLGHAQAIQGFLKYYALYDMSIGNVVQDILFHTVYGQEGTAKAKAALEEAFAEITL